MHSVMSGTKNRLVTGALKLRNNAKFKNTQNALKGGHRILDDKQTLKIPGGHCFFGSQLNVVLHRLGWGRDTKKWN